MTSITAWLHSVWWKTPNVSIFSKQEEIKRKEINKRFPKEELVKLPSVLLRGENQGAIRQPVEEDDVGLWRGQENTNTIHTSALQRRDSDKAGVTAVQLQDKSVISQKTSQEAVPVWGVYCWIHRNLEGLEEGSSDIVKAVWKWNK